jgi:hypothetical protein
MESATPYILFFCAVGILGSFLLGIMIGWFGNDIVYAFLNRSKQPIVHPELFDENGNLIPDEILAVSFNPEYLEDEETDEDEES